MSHTELQRVHQLVSAGQMAEADRVCREVLQAEPNNPDAARLLGQLTRRMGRAGESAQIFQQLRALRPHDPQMLGELGASLAAAEQAQAALPLLTQAVEQMPTAVQWKVWLGRCHLQLFDTASAIRVLREAKEDAPENSEVLFHLANALLTAGQPAHAEPEIRKYLEHKPASKRGRTTLASIYEHQRRLDEAADISRGILEEDPTNEAATGSLARCLRAEGKYDEALAVLGPVIEARPTGNAAMAVMPIYLATKRFEECKALIERVMRECRLAEPVKATLYYGLGSCLQGLGDHDEAFRAYKRANEIYPKSFNRAERLTLYQEIRRAFTPELLRDGPSADVDASRCVFVVGMPRSGTSLIEQILDAHPRVFGAGELSEVPFIMGDICKQLGGPAPRATKNASQDVLTAGGQRYLDFIENLAPDADFVVDKLPHNFEMIGLIRRILPGARIVHSTRDPIDNCVSCYFTQLSAWHSYSTDLANLGWAYGQYRKLMDYWKDDCGVDMLEVRYEDVVADTEMQARRVVDSIGLEWDPACLRFYETERKVTTASVDQVRQPIYASSVARWKRYGDHVVPLIESLKAAGVELAGV